MKDKILSPIPFFRMLKLIPKFYITLFPHIFWIVLSLALLQAIVPAFVPVKPSVGLAITILSIIVFMFFHAWALYHADSVLMERGENIWQSLAMVKHRFINLLGAIFSYFILSVALGLMTFALVRLGALIRLDILFFVISLIIILYITVLFAFSIPAIVLDGAPILKAFELSARMVWGHWWRTFAIMLIFSIPIVLLSLGVVFITSIITVENLLLITLYEFFYHIVAYPLFVAFTIILYHDLRYRYQAQNFKKVIHERDSVADH